MPRITQYPPRCRYPWNIVASSDVTVVWRIFTYCSVVLKTWRAMDSLESMLALLHVSWHLRRATAHLQFFHFCVIFIHDIGSASVTIMYTLKNSKYFWRAWLCNIFHSPQTDNKGGFLRCLHAASNVIDGILLAFAGCKSISFSFFGFCHFVNEVHLFFLLYLPVIPRLASHAVDASCDFVTVCRILTSLSPTPMITYGLTSQDQSLKLVSATNRSEAVISRGNNSARTY